ncbi:MAG: SMP-30/gluconolactonase/LRE family protein [Williamsia sp.]|nr:SMP-30/gluconolactonase/LRE family protein [Williamsia sp.]
MNKTLLALLIITLISACQNTTQQASINTPSTDSNTQPIATIEWYDSTIAPFIDTTAQVQIIAKGYNWTEGPLWIAKTGTLIFSDVPENTIFQWRPNDTATRYLTPSGYTKPQPAKGEIGSNGLTLDRNGNLLLCQSGNRQIARMRGSIASPAPDFKTLAATYGGKRFNSPNDIVADSKNNVYFTDPVYGLPGGEGDTARDLSFEGVYKISPTGKLSLLIDSIRRPNGIAFSPDERTLYIASSDNDKPAWYAYTLNVAGNPVSGGVLLDARPLKAGAVQKQGPDGMKVDNSGNLFSAGPDGINIISPAGRRLGLIKVYNRFTSNCSFSANKDTLYVTADDVVLQVHLHK